MKNLLIIVCLFLVLVAISSTDATEPSQYEIETQRIGIANDILDLRELLMKIETHEGLIYEYGKLRTDLLSQIRDNTAK